MSPDRRDRTEDANTVRTASPERTDRRGGVRPPWPDRLLRGLAGVLAGGLVLLAVGLIVVWLFSDEFAVPGPGTATVVGHVIGAVVAVLAQRVADRRPGRDGTAAAALVVVVTGLVLSLAWFI